MADATDIDLIEVTADLVSAYVTKNAVQASDLPSLIGAVHDALSRVAAGAQAGPAPSEKQTPAVPIRKSLQPDYLISLEDGRRYQTLKRHLAVLRLTPDEYRTKWGLAANYPMVAPNYSRRRSELAKSFGLGRKPGG